MGLESHDGRRRTGIPDGRRRSEVAMKIKCKECSKEFTDQANENPYPGKIYEHAGEALCENCLVGMGSLPDHSEDAHLRVIADSAWYYVRPY
jgi:hypothetical protein